MLEGEGGEYRKGSVVEKVLTARRISGKET